MPHPSHEGPPWADPLPSRLGKHANAAEVALAVATIWYEVNDALSPVIGTRGAAALYERSLMAAAGSHSWLMVPRFGTAPTLDPGALQEALARQAPNEARAAANLHFRSFNELFVSLVGRSLTERLLGSVWSRDAAAPPTQDSSS